VREAQVIMSAQRVDHACRHRGRPDKLAHLMTDDIGYEAARAELAEVVRKLETGDQPLEESLALWQRGEELADICQRWLDGATARLDEAISAQDGSEQ
jgi:exodeoxyribonuclease VII small subunit